MEVFALKDEQQFDPHERVERVLGTLHGGDFAVACWEPGQVSPYHCHPNATEIYFCFEGGGSMRTPTDSVEVGVGAFVVHPPGELHEYENGSVRTLLFRVRYGSDLSTRTVAWRSNEGWEPEPLDLAYLREHGGIGGGVDAR